MNIKNVFYLALISVSAFSWALTPEGFRDKLQEMIIQSETGAYQHENEQDLETHLQNLFISLETEENVIALIELYEASIEELIEEYPVLEEIVEPLQEAFIKMKLGEVSFEEMVQLAVATEYLIYAIKTNACA